MNLENQISKLSSRSAAERVSSVKSIWTHSVFFSLLLLLSCQRCFAACHRMTQTMSLLFLLRPAIACVSTMNFENSTAHVSLSSLYFFSPHRTMWIWALMPAIINSDCRSRKLTTLCWSARNEKKYWKITRNWFGIKMSDVLALCVEWAHHHRLLFPLCELSTCIYILHSTNNGAHLIEAITDERCCCAEKLNVDIQLESLAAAQKCLP